MGSEDPAQAPTPKEPGRGLFSLHLCSGVSPFRFLITVSAKTLSKQQLRSSCYLHRGLPTNLLLEPSFQERFSRGPFHACLKETFFWIFFFIPSCPLHFTEGRVKGTLAALGKRSGCLAPEPRIPTPTLAWLSPPDSHPGGTWSEGDEGPGTQALQC